MKTTVEIPDALMKQVKRVAGRDGCTMRDLIEEGLRKVVEERTRPASFTLRTASFGGDGLHPDVAEGSWERIRDLIYEGRGA